MSDALAALAGHHDDGDLPLTIRAELQTPLIRFLKSFLLLGSIGVPFLLMAWATDSLVPRWLSFLLAASLIIGFFGWSARASYVLDRRRRMVMYQFSCFSYARERVAARFDEVALVGIQCRAKCSSRAWWFEYAVMLVLKSGAQIQVTDFGQEGFLNKSLLGRKLATCIGVPFIEGQEKGKLVVEVGRDGRVSARMQPYANWEVALPMVLGFWAVLFALYLVRLFLRLDGP